MPLPPNKPQGALHSRNGASSQSFLEATFKDQLQTPSAREWLGTLVWSQPSTEGKNSHRLSWYALPPQALQGEQESFLQRSLWLPGSRGSGEKRFAHSHLLPPHIQRCTHTQHRKVHICMHEHMSVNIGTSMSSASWQCEGGEYLRD